MSTPSAAYRIHTASRSGEPPDASDDAAAVRTETSPVRAAVADGATESVYAGVWARCLVEQLVQADAASASAFAGAVEAGQDEWRAAVDERAAEQPWYVTAKVDEGAFAAALGLSIHDDGRWRAVAVGDCCLFHMRNDALDRAWPMTDPDAFSHRPALVSSLPGRDGPTPATTDGKWRTGDTFLLATDAVAAWLLRTDPTAAASWDDPFDEAVATARDEGNLRNDDATLVVLTMQSSSAVEGGDAGRPS